RPPGSSLEVTRSTLSSPGALSVFSFTPQQAGPGTMLTIQGQGFSATPSANTVRINGIVATVLSATANTLVVTVPSGAISGPYQSRWGRLLQPPAPHLRSFRWRRSPPSRPGSSSAALLYPRSRQRASTSQGPHSPSCPPLFRRR